VTQTLTANPAAKWLITDR